MFHLAKNINKSFRVGMDIAIIVGQILYGLSVAAAKFIIHNDTHFNAVEEIVNNMMLVSLESVNKRYQTTLSRTRKPII